MSLAYTALAAALCVVVMLTWRIWPVARGRAKINDSRAVRLAKWNRYLVRLMRRSLEAKVGVAKVSFFIDETGAQRSLATWAMGPTVIPDVEFIALANPVGSLVEVLALARAEALRTLLTDIHEQEMWGHQLWLYTWPDEADLNAVVAKLIPVAEFRETYGLNETLTAEAEPEPVADVDTAE